jgi:hypothetical protein
MHLRKDRVKRVRCVRRQQNSLGLAIICSFDILGGYAGIQTILDSLA